MIIKKSVAAAAIAGATLLGGAVGVTMLGTASAATTTTPAAPTTTATTPGTAATPGVRHSNEDSAHEAGESPAREAAEDNGTATYGAPGAVAPSAPTG